MQKKSFHPRGHKTQPEQTLQADVWRELRLMVKTDMSHQFKSPTMIVPLGPSSPRHFSPKALCPPPQPWGIKNGTLPQGSRNPYYNQYHIPNGYWGSPRQWSPNRWESGSNFRHRWGSSPRTPQNSHIRHSPEHASAYTERKDKRTQVPFRQKRGSAKDISHYYHPSMVQDPWAELQAKDSKPKP